MTRSYTNAENRFLWGNSRSPIVLMEEGKTSMGKFDDRRSLRCSFCGKPQSAVNRLIAGNGSYICDECVRMCASIIDEGGMPAAPSVNG